MSLKYRDANGVEQGIAGTPYDVIKGLNDKIVRFRDYVAPRNYYRVDVASFNWTIAKASALIEDMISDLGQSPSHGSIMVANGVTYVGTYEYFNESDDGTSNFYLSILIHSYGDSTKAEQYIYKISVATGNKTNITVNRFDDKMVFAPKVITKNFALATNTWTDTGINLTKDLDGFGTYIIQVWGRTQTAINIWDPCFTGIFGFRSNCNDTNTYNIPGMDYSHAYLNDNGLALRARNTTSSGENSAWLDMKFEKAVSAIDWNFQFRRLM